MNMRCLSLIAASSAVLAFALQEPAYEYAATGAFTREGVSVQGVGVCDISQSSIACWDMSGTPDKNLTQDVTDYVTSGQQYLRFSYGRKNRRLVVKSSGSAYVSFSQFGENATLSSEGRMTRSNGEEVELVRVATERDRTEASVLVNLSGLGKTEFRDLPLRIGAQATYQKIEFQVASLSEVKEKSESDSEVRKWNVVLDLKNPGQEPISGLMLTIYDKEGRLIRYVDKKGEPVSDVQALSEVAPVVASNLTLTRIEKYENAFFYVIAPYQPGRLFVETNVNPANVGALRIMRRRDLRVLLSGFPLDSK
jgi:hypothetical protein